MKKNKIILLMSAIGLICLTSINSCADDDAPDCPDTYVWDYESGTCVKVGQTGVY